MLKALKQLTLHDAAAFLVYALPIALAFSRAAGDIVGSLVALLFLTHCSIRRDWRWLREPWVWFALAFWVYAMGLGFFAERPDKAITRAALWIRYPLLAIAVAYWVCNAPHFTKRIIATITGSVVFLIGDSFLQYITGFDILGRPSLEDLHTPRLTGPYSSGRVGISMLWIGLPVVVYWFCKSLHPTRNWKRFAWASALLIAFCATIFISGERMALALCALGLGVTLLLAPGRLKLYSIAVLVASMALMALFAWQNPGLIGRQYNQSKVVLSDFYNSHYARIWGSALGIIEAHPITGVGLRHFREECPKPAYGVVSERDEESRCNTHPHNRYLEILTETGLIGGALWLAMIFCWMRSSLHALWRDRSDFFLMGLIAVLCVRLWPFVSTTSIMISWSAVPFWLVIGLLYTQIRKVKTDKE